MSHPWKQLQTGYNFVMSGASDTIVFIMAEGDRSTLFSKTDNDSVLPGSIILLFHWTWWRWQGAIRSWIRSIFCFTRTMLSVQQWTRLRNVGYSRFSGRVDQKHKPVLERRFFVCCINTECVFTGAHAIFAIRCQQLVSPELDNIRDLQCISWRSSSSLYHSAHWLACAELYCWLPIMGTDTIMELVMSQLTRTGNF